jgi:hypothetical protein
VRECVRALYASATVLSVLAIVQVGVFYATGTDIFPLGVFGDSSDWRSGMFGTDGGFGGSIFRASALGGEPKHLAYSLVLVLTVRFADQLTGGPLGLNGKRVRLQTAAWFGALVLTFSTQGYMLFAVNVVLVLVGVAFYQGLTRRHVMFVMGTLLVAMVALSIPGMGDVILQRTIGRIVQDGAVEDWNQAVWSWFRETPSAWPLGVGLGNVHLYAARYIPDEFMYYMGSKVFTAKSGLLRIASETGVAGMLLFLAPLLKTLYALRRSARRGSRLALCIMVTAASGVADFFASMDGPIYIFLLTGAAVATARVLRQNGAMSGGTGALGYQADERLTGSAA